jgi:hypothetical protein
MDSARLPEIWHNLYVMLGTSSAALVGLLFVATSFHLREIVNDAVYRLRAQYTMLILAVTLVQAAAILTPQPVGLLGAELLIANLWGLWLPLDLLYKAVRKKISGRPGTFSANRAIVFAAGYAVGVAGSVALIVRADWGMYLVTICYVNCLVASIWNAWKIMLGVGQAEIKHRR